MGLVIRGPYGGHVVSSTRVTVSGRCGSAPEIAGAIGE